MAFNPGDVGHLAEHDRIAGELAGRLSSTALSTTIDTTVAEGISAGIGSETQTAADARYTRRAFDSINVLANGVTGDGVTDETATVQALVDANPGRTFVFPGDGVYMIDANRTAEHTGINITQPGTKFLLEAGATIKVIPNGSDNYAAIVVSAADCVIEGGTILGDVPTHTGTTGEWGHLIVVTAGGDRCRIQGVTVKQAWGDGIVVQLGAADVSIIDVIADDNRRQGMSITGAIRPRVLGGVYKNTGLTKWTLPCAGIDIEPNPSSAFNVIDATITGVTFFNNRGEGLLAIRATGVVTEATVMGCTAKQNGTGSTAAGFRAGGSAGTMLMKFVGCTSKTNTGHGFDIYAPNVEVTSCTARSNGGDGFRVSGTSAQLTSPVAAENMGAGIKLIAGSDSGNITGGITTANSQAAASASSNVEIASVNVRVAGHLSVAGGLTNRPACGFDIQAGAGARLNACDVSGSFVVGTFRDTPGTTTLFPRPGAGRAPAVTSPTADVTALKTAVDALRAALTSYGITA